LRARRFLAKHGAGLAFDLVDHKEADYLGKRGAGGEPPSQADLDKVAAFRATLERERDSPHRLADLAVDGNDLIELGFLPGPQLGHALRELLQAVVEDPGRNTREELLRRAARLADGAGGVRRAAEARDT
jgi:tRNA nucleotidyltransferase (CCA-adding enzyme)